MAKKKKKSAVTKQQQPALVVQEIRITSADRRRKDIAQFKNALESAESTWYPNRVLLYDLYDYIIIDGHLSGILNKRFDSVLNKKLLYNDAAGKKIDSMDDMIASEAFREIVRKIMQSNSHGLSGLEFVPGAELRFEEIPRKHIKIHKRIISMDQEGHEGIDYTGLSNVWVIGEEKNLGYLLQCAPYAIWKFGAFSDWAQYLEIFGQPVRVVYYDANDQKTKMELRQVLDEAGSSLALMIPKQAQFEMKDGKQSNGNGELQEKFKKACNDEMSVVVLGNTESTSSSSSSGYAQSETHSHQQMEITRSDMKFVENMLNSSHFFRILKSYGLPVVEGGRFSFAKEVDLKELKLRLEIDEKVDSKVPIDPDYWYETYGLQKPANFDALMKERQEMKLAKVPPAQPPVPPRPASRKLQPKGLSALIKALSSFFVRARNAAGSR